jgi:hypothetical protein
MSQEGALLLPYLLGGVGVVLVEITPKKPARGSLIVLSTGNLSKLALVNIHLPSNVTN